MNRGLMVLESGVAILGGRGVVYPVRAAVRAGFVVRQDHDAQEQ